LFPWTSSFKSQLKSYNGVFRKTEKGALRLALEDKRNYFLSVEK